MAERCAVGALAWKCPTVRAAEDIEDRRRDLAESLSIPMIDVTSAEIEDITQEIVLDTNEEDVTGI